MRRRKLEEATRPEIKLEERQLQLRLRLEIEINERQLQCFLEVQTPKLEEPLLQLLYLLL